VFNCDDKHATLQTALMCAYNASRTNHTADCTIMCACKASRTNMPQLRKIINKNLITLIVCFKMRPNF